MPMEFWIQLASRFVPYHRDPENVVLVSVDELLQRRTWLSQLCQRWNISLQWEDSARDAVGQFVNLSVEFDQVRNAGEETSVAHFKIGDLLEATRFAGQLRGFQLRDLSKLVGLLHGANYSVPGAGKTAVAYALHEIERHQGRVDQLVVIAPLSAFGSWIDEGKQWLEPAPAVQPFGEPVREGGTVALINYQRVVSRFDEVAKHVSKGSTHLVLDEAHRIKRGWSGEWGSACLRLAYLAERRDVLTGTPAPNHPRDLEPLVDFCWPGQGRRALPEGAFDPHPLPTVLAEASVGLKPFYVRTTKDELGLPTPEIDVIEVPCGPLQSDIYAALRHRFAGRAALNRRQEVQLAEMGRIIMYLLEAASNPALLASGSSRDDPEAFHHPPLEIPNDSRLVDLISNYGRHETPPKFVEVAKIVAANRDAGEKTLVWSNFVRNLEWLANRVLTAMNPAVIHGGVPIESSAIPTRDEEIARFRNDSECWVLLANPAAMAEGISLHRECNHAVYIDRTFNAGQFLQSQDRIHRLGLPVGVNTTITILMSVGTVDEIVDRRVEEKVRTLSALMQDQGLPEMTLPDEDNYGPPIDNDVDLEELFSHLRGS